MSKAKRFFLRILLFCGITLVAGAICGAIGLQSGDSGWGIAVLATVIVYYIVRAKVGLGNPSTIRWQPNTPITKGIRQFVKLFSGVTLTVESQNSGITGSVEPMWASGKTGDITNDNGIQWMLIKIQK